MMTPEKKKALAAANAEADRNMATMVEVVLRSATPDFFSKMHEELERDRRSGNPLTITKARLAEFGLLRLCEEYEHRLSSRPPKE